MTRIRRPPRAIATVLGAWLLGIAGMAMAEGSRDAAMHTPLASDEVALRIEYSTASYELDASSFSELLQQFETRRPGTLSKQGSHALTELNWMLSYSLDTSADECRLVEPVLTLSMREHLPSWRPRRDVADTLLAQWSAMAEGLDQHEAGHQTLARESAQRVVAAMNALPNDLSCRALLSRIERVWLREWTRMEIKQAAYDRRTQHGVRQGAVLVVESGLQSWRDKLTRIHRGG